MLENLNSRRNYVTEAPVRSILVLAFAMAAGYLAFESEFLRHFGAWYYVASPAVILLICAILWRTGLFFIGALVAYAASIAPYLIYYWTASRPEGLVILGHVLSMPGGAISLLLFAIGVRTYKLSGPLLTFALGFAGFGTGYLLVQIIICNTVLFCGPLSLKVFL